METIEFELSEDELNMINHLSTEKAALEICKLYFKETYPRVSFNNQPANGVDLEIRYNRRRGWLSIEVKGTRKPDVAWALLKVSGRQSYVNLRNDMLLYRVCNIGHSLVKINIMKHSEDFVMIREPRWRVRERE